MGITKKVKGGSRNVFLVVLLKAFMLLDAFSKHSNALFVFSQTQVEIFKDRAQVLCFGYQK